MKDYVAFDLETTGLSPDSDQIIEIGAVKIRDGKISGKYNCIIHPEIEVSDFIINLTGISRDMLRKGIPLKEGVEEFLEFSGDLPVLGHNVMFDYSFVKCSAVREGLTFEKMGIDTLKIARKVHKDFESKSLGALCDYYHIENPAAHRAYYDALATAKLYQTLAHYFEPQDSKVFQPLQLQYKIKKVQPATPKQIALLERLTEQKELIPDWDTATLTRSEASRIIDRLLKS